jgi:hypothetical protein
MCIAPWRRLPGPLEVLLLKRLYFALCVGLASTFIGFGLAMAAPVAQSNICPVAADDVVAGAIGEPVTIDPLFVTVDGTDTECIFDTANNLVLVRRQNNFFDDGASGATPEQIEQLRTFIFDQVDYTPVSGVGDAAFLATVSDRSLAPERQAVLIIKRGSDVFAFGVMDTPDALTTATALAQAVIAAQPT